MSAIDPRAILRAYSEQKANKDEVMRALTEHGEWMVPTGFALKHFREPGQTDMIADGGVVIFSQQYEADPSQLLLFTDRIAASRAEGHRIGMFQGSYSGARIFAALDNEFTRVSINPCSPKEECWYFEQDAFPLAQLWAQVVSLETALRTAEDASIPYAQIAAHPGYILLINDQNLPIDVALKGIEGKCAIAFTAPDRYEAFLASQPESVRGALRRVTLTGASMCRQLQNFEVSGVVVNLGAGADTVVLPRVQFASIAAAAA